MFTPEYFIDGIQNAKKQIVNKFVVDEKIKAGIIEVIDAQTAFLKTSANNVLLMSQLFVKNFAPAK